LLGNSATGVFSDGDSDGGNGSCSSLGFLRDEGPLEVCRFSCFNLVYYEVNCSQVIGPVPVNTFATSFYFCRRFPVFDEVGGEILYFLLACFWSG